MTNLTKSSKKQISATAYAEKELAFRGATRSFTDRYAEEIAAGMTDEELHDALASNLGTFGGFGGPDMMSVSYAGSGLRIWIGYDTFAKPVLAGAKTIAMARYVYDIANPDDGQMRLL